MQTISTMRLTPLDKAGYVAAGGAYIVSSIAIGLARTAYAIYQLIQLHRHKDEFLQAMAINRSYHDDKAAFDDIDGKNSDNLLHNMTSEVGKGFENIRSKTSPTTDEKTNKLIYQHAITLWKGQLWRGLSEFILPIIAASVWIKVDLERRVDELTFIQNWVAGRSTVNTKPYFALNIAGNHVFSVLNLFDTELSSSKAMLKPH